MKLIFLSGLPGVGKLTVGRGLAALTGYRLFHNHLTVDLLLAVFEFGSPAFVELREAIWLSVFERACEDRLPGLIFTFNAENTVRQSFISKATEAVASRGGEIVFVALACDESVMAKRLDAPERRQFGKLVSLAQYEKLKAAGAFSLPKLPSPRLTVDTGALDPKAAAMLIQKECGL